MARASAAFDRLPIRTRLAAVSALLTFVILCAFAVAIGGLTVHRIRADFNRNVAATAEEVAHEVRIVYNPSEPSHAPIIEPPLTAFAGPGSHTEVRLMSRFGEAVIAQAPTSKFKSLGHPQEHAADVNDYRVVVARTPIPIYSPNGYLIGEGLLQYGRATIDTEATVRRVELFLLLGVLAGTALALLAGRAIARRAMTPIAELTSTAAEIARTRDPSREVPQVQGDDEVAELARTLQGMLQQLDAARSETEAMLARQRQFVADASHELRTPLTSVLANLELLAESLDGEQGEAAASALRSSRRMRRLVADLLLLARSDVGRVVPHRPCDLAQVAVEAAGELGPVSAEHDISLDVQPAVVEGARDELHRLTINLIENAIRHTPPGTHIHVSTRVTPDGQAELVVEDDGPGVPPELASTLFERFVRGAGDRGGSFGLGLAIVEAVANSHGGSVTLERRDGDSSGARFVVRLPARSDLDDDRENHRATLQTVVD
jgi:signal transduction histidine kinase